MEKEARRVEILHAARRVFATKGYHEAKVDDIAAAAGVAKGTVYLYFRDKRSMFVELVDQLFMRLGAAILRVDTEGDVVAQIKHNIRAILGVLLDDGDTLQMLLSYASALDRAFADKIQSFHEGLKAMLTSSLEDGQRGGLVEPGDARLYASLTIGALKEVLIEQAVAARASSRRSREQIVEGLYAFLERGYLRVPALDVTTARSPVRRSARAVKPRGGSRSPRR